METIPRSCVVLYSLEAEDRGRRSQLLALANRLNAEGIDTEIDMYHASPPEGWPVWMERMAQERTVLIACTEQLYAKFDGSNESGEGGAEYEARIIRHRLKVGKGSNSFIIPVLLSADDVRYVPVILADVTRFDVSSDEGYERLYGLLTGREINQKPSVGTIRPLRAPNSADAPAAGVPFTTDDQATRSQIAVALGRLLTAMRRVFVRGQFSFGEWQELHNQLDTLARGHKGARALGPRYAEFCKALDHDQFSINYGLGLHKEFEEKRKAFGTHSELLYKERETRQHDALMMQNIADDVQTLAPFLRDFGDDGLAERLEYSATANREIAERTLREPPDLSF
jgi:hypothetical protein